MSNVIDRHQASHECDRRLRQRLHRQCMAPPRTAPVHPYTPPAPGLVNRASHYVLAPGASSTGVLFGSLGQVVRRYPKLRGKRQVKAAKRARQQRRLQVARWIARRSTAS